MDERNQSSYIITSYMHTRQTNMNEINDPLSCGTEVFQMLSSRQDRMRHETLRGSILWTLASWFHRSRTERAYFNSPENFLSPSISSHERDVFRRVRGASKYDPCFSSFRRAACYCTLFLTLTCPCDFCLFQRGCFILFEGIDRCGKTTQCQRLVEFLKKQGKQVEFMRFPERSTVIGQTINSYLTNGIDMDDRAIHL